MKASSPVVITTQSTDAGIRSEQFDIRHVPLITTETLPFDESVLDLSYDWLVLTSRNAVEHFLPYISRVDYRKLASIGRKTSESLEAHGLAVDFEPEGYSQEGFMDEFEPKAGERVLYPVSRNARPLMYDFLNEAGCEVERIRLYRPVAKTASKSQLTSLIEAHPLAIAFFSPSGVEVFMQWFDGADLDGIKVIAIGHVTGDALKKHGVASIQPERESMEDIIRLLENGIE